jgi:hypothetical protein
LSIVENYPELKQNATQENLKGFYKGYIAELFILTMLEHKGFTVKRPSNSIDTKLGIDLIASHPDHVGLSFIVQVKSTRIRSDELFIAKSKLISVCGLKPNCVALICFYDTNYTNDDVNVSYAKSWVYYLGKKEIKDYFIDFFKYF